MYGLTNFCSSRLDMLSGLLVRHLRYDKYFSIFIPSIYLIIILAIVVCSLSHVMALHIASYHVVAYIHSFLFN